jgi:hypothetical protein
MIISSKILKELKYNNTISSFAQSTGLKLETSCGLAQFQLGLAKPEIVS